MLGLLTCIVVQAAWFWPSSPEPAAMRSASSFAEVSAKGEISQGAKFEEDLSSEIQAVAANLAKADRDTKSNGVGTANAADQSINEVEAMGIESDALANKTVSFTQQVVQATSTVKTASDQAILTVDDLLDAEKTQAVTEQSDVERLREKAYDTNLRSQAEGTSKLQALQNAYAGNSMNAKQAYDNFIYQADQQTDKTELKAKEEKQKYENKFTGFENKLESMLDAEKDAVGTVGPANKDFEKYMKDSNKEITSDNKDLRKDIKDIETKDKLMNYKNWEKTFARTNKDIEDGMEDLVEDAQDAFNDVVDDGEKHAKDFTKGAEKQLKGFNKLTEKATKDQASEIKSQEKDTAKLAKSLGKMEENLESIGSTLSSDSADFGSAVSTVGHETAEGIVEMNADVTKDANKALENAQTDADEMISEMSDKNSRATGDLRSKQSADVSTYQDETQKKINSINSYVGGISQAITEAKTKADDVGQDTAETTAKVEVDGLKATKISEEAKKVGAASVYAIHQHVKAMEDANALELQDFSTDLDAVVSSMKTQIGAQPMVVAGPIEQKAQETKRYLEAHLGTDSLTYEGLLTGLFEQYKKVSHMMQQMGISPKGDVPENSVGKEIQRWEDSMAALVGNKDDLEQTVQDDKDKLEKEVSMAVTQLVESGRESSEQIKTSKEKALRRTEQQAFDSIGQISRMITNQIGRSQSNADASKQSDAYARQRLDKMSLDMTAGEKVYAEMDAALRSKLSDCYALLAEHETAMKAAGQSARDKIQTALLDAEEQQKAFLKTFAASMLTRASDNQAAQLKAIEDYEDHILQSFSASRDVEQGAMLHIDSAAESLRYETVNTTKTLEQAISSTTEQAEQEAQQAQLMAAQTTGYEGNIQTDMTNLAEAVNTNADAAIEATSSEEDRAIAAAGAKLKAEEQAIAKQESGVWQEAGAVVDAVSGDVATTGKLVGQTVSGYHDKAEFLEKDLKERIASMGEHIENDNQSEEDNEQAFENSVASQDKKASSTDSRNDELLQVMEKDVHAVSHETESRIAGEMAKLDANSQAIAGDITTSIETAEMTGRTARQSLEESELDLDRSRGDLRGLMKNVQTVLQRKLNETQRATTTISGLTATERDMLEKNTAYLRQYDLLTQSQVLGLIEKIGGAIENGAKATMNRYKDVQDHIDEVKSSINSLAETDTFSTLGKIMDADTYVQHASVENQDVVNYLEEFQKDQETFMAALVAALEDGQYAMILHENEVRAQQGAIDADAAGLTTAVIGSISALINGTGDGADAAALEKMSAGTLEMLLKKAMNGSEQDKAQVALFFARIAAKGYDGIKHLKNAGAIMDVINSLAGSNGSYDMMKADLQRVVDFNQKLVDDERRRMEARGLALSDSLFFGSRGINAMRTPSGFEHVPQWQLDQYKFEAKQRVQASYDRESFLERERKSLQEGSARAREVLLKQEQSAGTPQAKERASKLRSLLEQNAKLVDENHELGLEHDHISKDIQSTDAQIKAKKAAASKAKSTAL